MRYISTLENNYISEDSFVRKHTIVIKDTIDNEVYNIKDLDITELDYIMGKGFSNEVFAIQEHIEGKTEFENRTISDFCETITHTNKEGTINTSPILEESIIDVETDTIVVNNRSRCKLYMNHIKPSCNIKLKVKTGTNRLLIHGDVNNKVDFIISEKDLLGMKELFLSTDYMTLGIEELNRDTPTKELIPTRITRLKVKCKRFSMLNLLNVPYVQWSYTLCTTPYNIGEWLSKVRGEPRRIHIKENGTILNWIFNLEDYENNNIYKWSKTDIYFQYDGTTEELDLVNDILSHDGVTYIKTYQDLVIKLKISSHFREAFVNLRKKEGIK